MQKTRTEHMMRTGSSIQDIVEHRLVRDRKENTRPYRHYVSSFAAQSLFSNKRVEA